MSPVPLLTPSLSIHPSTTFLVALDPTFDDIMKRTRNSSTHKMNE